MFVFSCAQPGTHAEANREQVTIAGNGVFIPGTKISQTDQENLNKILGRFDKSLYQIQIYKNGKLQKTMGALSEDILARGKASEIASNAQRRSLSGWAIQIGDPGPMATVSKTTSRPQTPIPNPVRPNPSPLNTERLEQLVKKVTPTLEHYSDHS